MSYKNLLCPVLAIFMAGALTAGTAHSSGTPVAIINPSFEFPDRPDGLDASALGWPATANGTGVWNPEGTYFTGVAGDEGIPAGADGTQILYSTGGPKYVRQILVDTLQVGTYTLTISVGRTLPDTLSTDDDSFIFSLSTDVLGGYRDGTPLATYTGLATELTPGAFVDKSLVYSVEASNEHIGELLRIDLGSEVAWSFFDNVRLYYRTRTGDVNGDNMVNEIDATALAENWLSSDVGWAEGDFNGDGTVNDLDAALLAANWTQVVTSAQVPEPSSLVFATCIVFGLLGLIFAKSKKDLVQG